MRRQHAFRDADVLGEAALLEQGEHVVAGTEPRHVLADRLDLARHVAAQDAELRGAQPQAAGHQARDVRLASHVVPVVRVDGGGAHPDQHLVGRGHGLVDVGEVQVVG